MPFEIGRAFSSDVFQTIDRARDRAAANPPRISRRERYNNDLAIAMLRAAQEDKDRELRKDLAGQQLDFERTRFDAGRSDADREYELALRQQGFKETSGDRSYELAQADDALAQAREENLAAARNAGIDLRTRAQDETEARNADRADYERGVLDLRNREADLTAQRLQADADAQRFRMDAERTKNTREAAELLRRLTAEALRPGPDGQVSRQRVATFVQQIQSLKRLWLQDKNLPRDEIERAVSSTLHALSSGSGLGGGVSDEDVNPDEADAFLDLSLPYEDEQDTPPRFGR